MREICHFGHEATMSGCRPRQAKISGGHDVRAVSHAHAASDRSRAVPTVTQLDFTGPLQVFSSLPGAKVHLIWKRIEPVAERFRAGADADHDLCGLPAARRHLRARRVRHRRHDQRRGDAGLPAQAGARREIHHLGLHGIAGAGRRRPAQRLPRDDALDGDGFSQRRSARSRPRRASASTATASPAAASPPASISR